MKIQHANEHANRHPSEHLESSPSAGYQTVVEALGVPYAHTADATTSRAHPEYGPIQVCQTCANLWGESDA